MLIRRPGRPDPDRLVVIISDVEMGTGGVHEDFPHGDWLGEVILSYNRRPYRRIPVDVVFNGDTFDLLKTDTDGAWPRAIHAGMAAAKMSRIADAHRAFFEAIREFVAFDKAPRRVFFTVGNHDYELLFPAAQAEIRRRVGHDPRVIFAGFSLTMGDMVIEHGSQLDSLFRINPRRPFVIHDGVQVLNIPFGVSGLLDVAMPLLHLLYHHDRLKPRPVVFEALPELQDLLVAAYWRYWTRDYPRSWLTRNAIARPSWAMFKELVSRFRTRKMDVSVADKFRDRLLEDTDHRLYVIGHEHQPSWWTWGAKKVLSTGATRNEFMITPELDEQVPIPKVYAEVLLRDGRVASSDLVELECPPLPEGWMPETPLADVVDAVRAELAPPEEQRALTDEIVQHEAEEAIRASAGLPAVDPDGEPVAENGDLIPEGDELTHLDPSEEDADAR